MSQVLRRVVLAAGVVGLSAVAAGRAGADVITYSSTTTTGSGFDGIGGLSGTLPQFNPALGTLEEVSVSGTVSFQASVTVVNPGGSPLSFAETYHAYPSLAFVISNNGLGSVQPVPPSQNLTLAGTVGPFGTGTFSASGGASMGGFLNSTNGFTGTGLISYADEVGFVQGGGQSYPYPASFSFSQASATISYTYSPAVPEPSSLVLAGTAVALGLGVAWLRRRRAGVP